MPETVLGGGDDSGSSSGLVVGEALSTGAFSTRTSLSIRLRTFHRLGRTSSFSRDRSVGFSSDRAELPKSARSRRVRTKRRGAASRAGARRPRSSGREDTQRVVGVL